VSSECKPNPYLVPRLYVKGLKSSEYLVPIDSGQLRLDRSCRGECYGKAIYGTLLEELVDLVSKRVIRSFIVVLPPDYERALVVDEGKPVEPIPVEGMRTIIDVCEGARVKEGDVLAYIVTRKYELRKVRSHVSGVVVYIYSSPESHPDRNVILVAGEDHVREARIRR
jgi:hypothetical protein